MRRVPHRPRGRRGLRSACVLFHKTYEALRFAFEIVAYYPLPDLCGQSHGCVLSSV